MAISKSVVRKFLNRNLNDYTWLKEKDEKYIDHCLNQLNPRPQFHTNPYLHQKVGFLLGVKKSCFLMLLELGTGKTKLILDVFNYRKQKGEVSKLLVLVPYVVSQYSWETEVKVHTPNLKTVILDGPIESRLKKIEEGDGDVFLLNYPGLVYMCTSKPGKKRVLNYANIDLFTRKFDMVVYDECHALKSHNSITFKISEAFSSRIRYRYGMTGTLFGRNPHDVWAQYYAIDRGETMGRTLGIFRQAFFVQVPNPYSGWYDYVFDKKKKEVFHRTLKNRSIQYQTDECNTLPDLVKKTVSVDIPNDAYQYLKQIVEDYVKNEDSEKSRGGIFVKMRQVCSGYLNLQDEETGDTHTLKFKPNPRLEALKELVEELPDGRKMVIFNEFTYSGDLICEMLKKMKIKHERLYGKTKDHQKALNRFLTDPECRIFVVNSKSGAAGLNLQIANYVVFYESPVSPIVRSQAEKRCHRTGQKLKVFMYDLVSTKGPDRKILGFLKEGRDLYQSLIVGEANISDLVD